MTGLSAVGEMVRRHDPDRFLTALFAPAERREALFVLYAFNHELARAREVAREPMLAMVWLQWWREVVEGARRRHEVAGPLGEALDGGALAAGALLEMIEGRELEVEGVFSTVAEWRGAVGLSAGGVAVAAGMALGAREVERLRALGAAYGVAGQIGGLGVFAAQGRCLVPDEMLAAAGTDRYEVMADVARAPVAALVGEGERFLGEGSGRFARSMVAAALPGVLARRDLRRGARVRGIGDRLAVMAAWTRGRV